VSSLLLNDDDYDNDELVKMMTKIVMLMMMMMMKLVMMTIKFKMMMNGMMIMIIEMIKKPPIFQLPCLLHHCMYSDVKPVNAKRFFPTHQHFSSKRLSSVFSAMSRRGQLSGQLVQPLRREENCISSK